MRVIVWATAALDDLRYIEEWLERNASSGIAVATLSAIKERAAFLEQCPKGARQHGKDARVLRVLGTSYLIYYRLVDDRVEVLRLRHERENWADET